MVDDSREELLARINKHLPPIDKHPYFEGWPPFSRGENPDDTDVWLLNILFAAKQLPTGYLDVWYIKYEESKLDEIRRTILKLEYLWDSLPESVREEMEGVSIESAERIAKLNDYPFPSLDEIFEAFKEPDFLKEIFKSGRDVISQAYSLGRRNWRAVCVVDACRAIWHRRTGDKAPINVNPTSPFGKFVEDIFIGFGLEDDPRSAMQAWREVQSKDENT